MKLLIKIKLYQLNRKYKDPKVKQIVELFNNIFLDIEEYVSYVYPESTFFKHKDKVYFELDLKNDKTWCRYTDFWSKFETKFKLKDLEIRKLIEYMLGIHLKRKIPPTALKRLEDNALLGIHLKRKVPPN